MIANDCEDIGVARSKSSMAVLVVNRGVSDAYELTFGGQIDRPYHSKYRLMLAALYAPSLPIVVLFPAAR